MTAGRGIGCQSQNWSTETALVKRVTPLPSAFIVWTSWSPDRTLSKTIFVPSGDHAGFWSGDSLTGVAGSLAEFVRRVTPVPSAFIL